MSPARVVLLTTIAMVAFAANSLLCRLALKGGHMDAASFTLIRLLSGAAILWLMVRLRSGESGLQGNWPSALALFVYGAGFSFAYLTLSAASGALLLFGAVQATMIGYGLWRGEHLHLQQWTGLILAGAGLVGLMLPGLSAPPPGGAALMVLAGIAWGVYSLRGRGSRDATASTAGNFVRTVPMVLVLALIMAPDLAGDALGVGYAIASGALASGLGYALWYAALPGLRASSAASVQLSVPVIAALGGTVLLDEPVTIRLVLASAAILGGIALVILKRR